MEGIDGLLERLLDARYNKGKRSQLNESEIRQLCITAKQIFLNQPVLLELEAPVNICGTSSSHICFFFWFLFIYFCMYVHMFVKMIGIHYVCR